MKKSKAMLFIAPALFSYALAARPARPLLFRINKAIFFMGVRWNICRIYPHG